MESDYRIESLGKTFDIIIAILGIKHLPSQEVSQKIVEHLTIYHHDLYPIDIEIAFDLALAGIYEIDLSHYHSFDLKYISAVLVAYKKHRYQIIIDNTPIEPPKPMTDSELYEMRLEIAKEVQKLYEQWDADTMPIPEHYEWSAQYKFLNNIGLIGKIPPDYANELMAKAKVIVSKIVKKENSGQPVVAESIISAMMADSTEQGRVKQVARHLYLVNLFSQWKENKVDVVTFVTSKVKEHHGR